MTKRSPATGSLKGGNLAWPRSRDFFASLAELGITVPPNLEVIHDETPEGTRVLTFNCDDPTVELWPDLIHAVFGQVHQLNPDAPITRWVTRP